MKKVIITVDALGDVKFDADGFNGEGCVDATKVFEDVFSGKKSNREFKNEYYLPDNSVRVSTHN